MLASLGLRQPSTTNQIPFAFLDIFKKRNQRGEWANFLCVARRHSLKNTVISQKRCYKRGFQKLMGKDTQKTPFTPLQWFLNLVRENP